MSGGRRSNQKSAPILCLTLPTPRCNRSSFYDKQRLDETRNLKCPYTDCHYVWCKSCQLEITPWSLEHPCDDGSSALKRLVQERGWKYCPSESIPFSLSRILVRADDPTACRTPCEKISGCNLVSVSGGRQKVGPTTHYADLSYSNLAVHHSRVQFVSFFGTCCLGIIPDEKKRFRKAILLWLWRIALQAWRWRRKT